ncbi:hypothetical protein BDV96DRAFT_378078 [Lophiotrema nucula]|uniref:C2H2-type domain-containing protein n=1 Tax=Lophiotrema nucula TaxID=690887 RepID=A0A6A5ZF41_9PLEO|nr:hypothetical protein BDV96DRAFT_378078 [Lophiotrema nucula]
MSPMERYSSADVDEILPANAKPNAPNRVDSAARIAASKSSSRMSIERYLSAPLEDEPASVPAISAALRRQTSHRSLRHTRGHSRESSLDANSDGRRTFYTSGSAPESTGTSYSAVSKVHRRQPSNHLPELPELPRHQPREKSPERPTTSGTMVDMEKTWAEQIAKFMPGYQEQQPVDYHTRAQAEIARIQEKARQLQQDMEQYRTERENSELLVPRVTDEQAYAQMAARPKLAWILGGDMSDAKSIERPKSSGSAIISPSDTIPERPSSSSTMREPLPSRIPRRSKSNGALDENARQSLASKASGPSLDRKPSRRARFFCTFCQKRFHSRVEWMRHEQTIHMPEELWICCPRTGEFPERCPFCAKGNPSPSHLADHNYLSCQEKPLSERTFSRKDYFLQHLSQVHKISPGQKPQRLAELVEAWRHPLPLKTGHQALHCGFCGQTFSTYAERTHHVGNHFMEGLDMMSWWNARASHTIAQPETKEAINTNP